MSKLLDNILFELFEYSNNVGECGYWQTNRQNPRPVDKVAGERNSKLRRLPVFNKIEQAINLKLLVKHAQKL